tara:strand:+ start:93 stop:692 length:600 start_codon:yes stop_codon:yes gene_type:complete
MNILAFETASSVCGVALFIDGKMAYKDEINKFKIHGQRLPIITKNILQDSKIKIKDLDGIAISSGPGSYTGLRIGMSFAKGLAASNSMPLIPVSTLLAMNYSINERHNYCIMLHSHSEYVYSQHYANGKPISDVVFKKYTFNKDELIYGFNLDKLDIDFVLSPPSVEAVGILSIENFTSWKKQKISGVIPNYITGIKNI